MADAHKNLAKSTVATAPSPATTGTSLVVDSGHGTRFPTPPFNATIQPATGEADPSNAEIVRVTGISTDTFTIVREQEGTTARTVVVGDKIAATITAKTLEDAEANVTLLVAATDAPAHVKARADYQCDGTNDETDISTAVSALPSGGGTVQLSEGTFTFGAALNLSTIGKPFTLAGSGNRLTTIVRGADFGSPIGIDTTDGVTVRDFALNCGYASLATNANHGIAVFDCSNFLAQRIRVTDWKNTAILIYQTTPNADSNAIIDDCEAVSAATTANNGFSIVAYDYSGIRNSFASGIRGTGPNYAVQLKNTCRWCFIENCTAADSGTGIGFGQDITAQAVSYSRVVGGTASGCDAGFQMGYGFNNTVTGLVVDSNTNVNDGLRLENSKENAIVGVEVRGVGASRACIRFAGTSTDNYIDMAMVDSSSGHVANFASSGPERNTVVVRKFGAVPTNIVADTSGVTTNAVILGPGCTHSGTPTGHKWGIFNKEPVAQQANTVAARTVLENFGLLATGGTETATQAEQETGTSTTVFVTPGRQHFHPSAAKFWVTATGNSTTILASYNMTSWADTGTGDADGTIATDFSSANWCGAASVMFTGGSAWDASFTTACGFDARAAGTFGVLCSKMQDGGTAAAALVDPTTWDVVGFGDHA